MHTYLITVGNNLKLTASLMPLSSITLHQAPVHKALGYADINGITLNLLHRVVQAHRVVHIWQKYRFSIRRDRGKNSL